MFPIAKNKNNMLFFAKEVIKLEKGKLKSLAHLYRNQKHELSWSGFLISQKKSLFNKTHPRQQFLVAAKTTCGKKIKRRESLHSVLLIPKHLMFASGVEPLSTETTYG
jgi:hypothetical protein